MSAGDRCGRVCRLLLELYVAKGGLIQLNSVLANKLVSSNIRLSITGKDCSWIVWIVQLK